MGPYLKTLLLLMGGQVAGQVGAAIVSTKIDPVPAEGPQGTLPVGGGASRGDEIAMFGGGAGSLYLATKLKSPEGRVFAVGMAMGAVAPITQALAQAVAKRMVGG